MRELATIVKEFPKIVVYAQCDDVIKGVKPEPGESWQDAYERLANCSRRQDELMSAIGLVRHPDKSKLTLPRGAPEPCRLKTRDDQDNELERMRPVLTVNGIPTTSLKGSVVSGIAFGEPSFIEAHVNMEAAKAAIKVTKTAALAVVEPHMAATLLSVSCRSHLQYTWQLTPPRFCLKAYEIYDSSIESAIKLLLCPTGTVAAPCDDARMARAVSLLRNPIYQGGANYVRATDDGPAAFVARFIASSGSKPMKDNHKLFESDIQDAHARVSALVGESRNVAGFFPRDANRLIRGTFSPSIPNSYPKGILGAISREIARKRFADQLDAVLALEEHIDEESVLHQLAVMLRSQMSRVFRCAHNDPMNRIEPRFFVPWLRYYLNLPRLVGIGEPVYITGAKCDGELCAAPHKEDEQPVIGPTADHLAHCRTVVWARQLVHNELRDLFNHRAILAGARSRTEVRAKVLLLNQYTDQELKGMNPKRKTPDSKKRAAQLLELSKKLEESRNEPGEFKATLELYTELVSQVPEDSAEVRPDVCMEGKFNQERWVDVGYVHTTKASGRAANLNFFKKLPKAEQEARKLGVASAMSRKASPPLEAYARHKEQKHRVLIGMAQAQVNRIRKKAPVFSACIVSHTGEWSQGVIQTIEWLCEQRRKAKRSLFGESRQAGSAVDQAKFRAAFKDNIACVTARGVGRILAVGGHFFPSKEGDEGELFN